MTIRDFPSTDIDCDELVDNPNEGADLPFDGGHLLIVLPESNSVDIPMPIGNPFEEDEQRLEHIESMMERGERYVAEHSVPIGTSLRSYIEGDNPEE